VEKYLLEWLRRWCHRRSWTGLAAEASTRHPSSK
jgi:hypothetical protein